MAAPSTTIVARILRIDHAARKRMQRELDKSARGARALFVCVCAPYMDGNGRMGRFLMNLMLAAGGYPWTVIPLERRNVYIAALEEASVRQDIVPFAKLLAGLVRSGLRGEVMAERPR